MRNDERRPDRKGAPGKGKAKGPTERPLTPREEMDKKVEDLRATSSVRPVRVVIDEVYPGGFYRVLSAEMRSKKKEADETDPASWGDEVEHYLDKDQLMRLLAGTGEKEIWEGKVFRVRSKRSKNIYDPVRKRAKANDKVLLQREGRTYDPKRKRW